jgi:hypothetical protein
VTHRLAILVAVGAAALVAAGSAAPKGVPLVGILGKTTLSQQLVRFDPVTLRPLPTNWSVPRVALDGHRSGWSFGGGDRLALGKSNESCVGGATTLRLVDVVGMRSLGDVRLVPNGDVLRTMWLDRSHLVAVVGLSDCIRSTGTAALIVDADARRVVARAELDGEPVAFARSRDRLLVLLAPRGRIGVTTLAVVDARGKVREAALGEIRAGQSVRGGSSPGVELARPGLTVNRTGRRAFVVPGGDRLAEVDLGSLAVRYHELTEQRSTLARFVRWLQPSASAKFQHGPQRQAIWLGQGRLAVTGADHALGSNGRPTSTAAGLRIVDTENWTYRTVSRQVSRIYSTGVAVLLATGVSYDGRKETGAGLIGYSLNGEERYHLFGDAPIWLAGNVGGRGYAQVPARTGVTTGVFEVGSGRLVRGLRVPLYELLLGDAAAF